MTDREKFEAWFAKEMEDVGCELSEFNNGNYRNHATQSYWKAWQAALASQQPSIHVTEMEGFHGNRFFNHSPPVIVCVDTAGWVEWKGGECPVSSDTIVDVKFNDGKISVGSCEASMYRWSQRGWNSDIIAYRVVKP